MESIKIENLSFIYPKREENALENINLTIKNGEFVTVFGMSGCGKTTLLRLLKPSISPYGILSGEIYFEGTPIKNLSARKETQKIGFVMQNPEAQIVVDKVWHEIAFGLENLGLKTAEIRARVSEMASFFGIEDWFDKNISELSGGQKQLLNLASVMVMNPSLVILDEPTSQLDPIAADEFLKMLHKINRELGTTVILSEHRLTEALPISDRVVLMDGGEIEFLGDVQSAALYIAENNHPMYLALPAPARIFGAVDGEGKCPLNVREGREWISEYIKNHAVDESVPYEDKEISGDSAVTLKNIRFRYEKDTPDILKNLNLDIKKGEFYAILGGNGVGKSTVLNIISGILKPLDGKVLIKGENILKVKNLYGKALSYLPQNPETLFTESTLFADLMKNAERENDVYEIAEICKVSHLLSFHPYDISGGEKQRAALCKVLLKRPEILLLDEPTKGLDSNFKEIFADILKELKKSGVTVIMVTHDIEFSAEYADRCALMFMGEITSEDTPRNFFAGKSFYTTSSNKMVREFLPSAVTAGDVITALGGKIPAKQSPPKYDIRKKSDVNTEKNVPQKKEKPSGKSVLLSLLTLLLIPLTIFFGMKWGGDRKFYFTSLLIILETAIPFFLMFEGRKPKAREIVLISVLCAIGVSSRAAFFMLPQFKPVIAIVIISGVCLGGETGFLVGAVTGFVSNFIFGQGPWTPWQMFSFGIIGFISGVIFGKGFIKKTKTALCIYGFFATVLIFGGIMNPASVLMWMPNPPVSLILASYASGLPLDIVHATATVIFMWVISDALIGKIERIKTKFGFLQEK